MTAPLSLADEVAFRRARGLDRWDECWSGEYRIVAGPSLEHQCLVGDLCAAFRPLARGRGLLAVPGCNIGFDKVDFRQPDVAVLWPDTARTSPAFMATAELVVEILSPDEQPGAKLDFYAAWHVDEYVEVDLRRRSALLLRRAGAGWEPAKDSAVIDLTVEPDCLVVGGERIDLPHGATA